jgi:hypothetical protein
MEAADLLLDNSQPPLYAGMIMRRSNVGWASVFLLAHHLYQLPRGQTIKPFAHPTRKDNTQSMATAR